MIQKTPRPVEIPEPDPQQIKIVEEWCEGNGIELSPGTVKDLAKWIPATSEERKAGFLIERQEITRRVKADLETCLQLQTFIDRTPEDFIHTKLMLLQGYLTSLVQECEANLTGHDRKAKQVFESILDYLVSEVSRWGINLDTGTKLDPSSPRLSLKTRLEKKGYGFPSQKRIGSRKILFIILEEPVLKLGRRGLWQSQIIETITELFYRLEYDTSSSKNSSSHAKVIYGTVQQIVLNLFE